MTKGKSSYRHLISTDSKVKNTYIFNSPSSQVNQKAIDDSLLNSSKQNSTRIGSIGYKMPKGLDRSSNQAHADTSGYRNNSSAKLLNSYTNYSTVGQDIKMRSNFIVWKKKQISYGTAHTVFNPFNCSIATPEACGFDEQEVFFNKGLFTIVVRL